MSKNSLQVKDLTVFTLLIIGVGPVFKLPLLKDTFYIPMQDYLHLSHLQIGVCMAVYGLVQTVGNFFSIFIADRWDKRTLIPLGLVGTGLCGFFLSTLPGYFAILLTWGFFAIFAEVIYWPVLLKSIRLQGSEREQGRLFAWLEAGSGIADIIVAYAALGIFVALGESAFGFKMGIAFLSAACVLVGLASFIVFPKVNDKTSHSAKNAQAIKGALQACKSPQIWVLSFTIFAIYSVYCGLTYFIPFLNDIYAVPMVLVGIYGIFSQYGVKIIGGPIGGILADKVFFSSAKFMRFASFLSMLALLGFAFLPHEKINVYVGVLLTIIIVLIVSSMRPVFFAPIAELKVKKQISGAAMSIACIFGYAPQMFSYALYGSILDAHPGPVGYKIVFLIMAFAAACAIGVANVLVGCVRKKQGLD